MSAVQSSDENVGAWSGELDFEPMAARDVVFLWALLIAAFVSTIAWLGFSFGIMAVRMGLV